MLAVAIASGKQTAEEALVQQYGPAVRRFLARRVPSPSVDDLFQDCFLVAITKLRDGHLRVPEKLGCFVIGIARRLLIAYSRSTFERREVPCDPEDLDSLASNSVCPEEVMERECVRRLMRTRLGNLEIDRDRQTLVRRYVLDEDAEAIAHHLGVSRSEVRVILCRARLRLLSACDDLRLLTRSRSVGVRRRKA